MEAQYLVDSNVVIEFLSGSLPDVGTQWLEEIVAEQSYCLSVINQIELLGFNGQAEEMAIVENFINQSSVLPLSKAIAQATITIRKNIKLSSQMPSLRQPQVVHQLHLLTRNTSDFQGIEELVLIDVHQM
ncbi:MAG: type II toxin-antitoxin system VapC family toxin [Bacteroidota bacterium]